MLRVGFGFFGLVAGATEDLQVAEVVGAALGDGDDVVDLEGDGGAVFAAVAAAVAIALQHGSAHRRRKSDA